MPQLWVNSGNSNRKLVRCTEPNLLLKPIIWKRTNTKFSLALPTVKRAKIFYRGFFGTTTATPLSVIRSSLRDIPPRVRSLLLSFSWSTSRRGTTPRYSSATKTNCFTVIPMFPIPSLSTALTSLAQRSLSTVREVTSRSRRSFPINLWSFADAARRSSPMKLSF